MGCGASVITLDPNSDLPQCEEYPVSTGVTHSNVPTLAEEHGGLIWHCEVVPDDMEVKARRPVPQIHKRDLQLMQIGKHWVLRDVLNEWPALDNLILASVTSKSGSQRVERLWSADSPAPPVIPDVSANQSVRLTLHAPTWTAHGWSKESPGFVLWFKACNESGPKVYHGEDILEACRLEPEVFATRVHCFAHRYPVSVETIRNRIFYHTAILMEWDHGRHITVIELAYYNGLSGYQGRCNWCRDRDSDTPTALYTEMGETMKAPWRTDRAEIRVIDMDHVRTKEEFMHFVADYAPLDGSHASDGMRFTDPQLYASADVCLAQCSRGALMQHLLNYITWDTSYTEEARNCQTFVADFFAFISGNRDTAPFHAACRLLYRPRLDEFLYKPHSLMEK